MTKLNTMKEAGEVLRCSIQQVRRYINAGELEAVRLGCGNQRRQTLITDEAIKAFLQRRTASVKSTRNQPAKTAGQTKTYI